MRASSGCHGWGDHPHTAHRCACCGTDLRSGSRASTCIGERRDYAIFFHSFSGILGSRLSLATSFAPAGCLEGLSLSFASSRACLRRASCLSRRARSFFVRASEVGGRVGGGEEERGLLGGAAGSCKSCLNLSSEAVEQPSFQSCLRFFSTSLSAEDKVGKSRGLSLESLL